MKNLKRRIVSMLLVLTLTLTFALSGAAQEPRVVEVELDYTLTVLFDGEPQNFLNAVGLPVLPMWYGWSIYLPVRALANLFEVPIEWEAETRTVILDEGELQPPPEPAEGFPRTGTVQAVVDPGVSIRLDGEYQVLTTEQGDVIYPIMFEGTIYLPVRALAGLFEVRIRWVAEYITVLLGEQPDEPTQPPDIPPRPNYEGWVSAPGHLNTGITNGDVRESGFPEQLQNRLAEGHFYNAMRLPDAVMGEESTAEFRADSAYFEDGQANGFMFQWHIGGTTADLAMGSRYRVSIINTYDGEVIDYFDWTLTTATMLTMEWIELVTFIDHGFFESIDSVTVSFKHLGGATISDIWIFDVMWF